MKKIFIATLTCILVFLIYLTTKDKKIYYLNIEEANGNLTYSTYLKNYLEENNLLENYRKIEDKDIRVTDLINMIEDNKKVDDTTIKNALIKADITTIKIGAYDILSKTSIKDINYNNLNNYLDDLIKDYDDLFKLIRTYCKENIYLIENYIKVDYNEEELKNFKERLRKRLKQLCTDYNIHYIETETKEDYEKIINEIERKIKEK